jgi:hypothetical protein
MRCVPKKGVGDSCSSHGEVARRIETAANTGRNAQVENILLAVTRKLKISFKSVGTPTSRDRVAFPTWKVEPFQNCSFILSSPTHHWQHASDVFSQHVRV